MTNKIVPLDILPTNVIDLFFYRQAGKAEV